MNAAWTPREGADQQCGNVRVDNAVVTVTAAGSSIQVRVRVANISGIRWNGNSPWADNADCGARTAESAARTAPGGST